MSLVHDVFLIVCGALLTFLFAMLLNRRIAWFVPAITTAELSRDLSRNLGLVSALAKAYSDRISSFSEQVLKGVKTLEHLEYAEEAISELLKAQALSQFRQLPEDIYERILRDVGSKLTRVISSQLSDRLQTIGSEYVLLHNLDEFEMTVHLSAGHSDWQTLQKALKRVERFRPETEKTGNVSAFDTERQFNAYLGRLGDALFDLKWQGPLSLRRTASSHAPETPASESRVIREKRS